MCFLVNPLGWKWFWNWLAAKGLLLLNLSRKKIKLLDQLNRNEATFSWEIKKSHSFDEVYLRRSVKVSTGYLPPIIVTPFQVSNVDKVLGIFENFIFISCMIICSQSGQSILSFFFFLCVLVFLTVVELLFWKLLKYIIYSVH